MKEHRGLIVTGLVALAAFVLYETGVVHFPNLERLIEHAGRALGQWTYLLVGALAFLETGAFVGLIAPGETAILLGGVVAGQGKIDVVLLGVIVWACAVAGDFTSFFLGRRLGRPFLDRHGPRVNMTPERVASVDAFFARHGGPAILLGRFVGVVRAIAPFLAGSGGMPLRRFAPYDILGAGLWGGTFVALGYIFWRSFDQVVAVAKKGAFALGAAIVLGVAIVALVRWWREPAHRARARDAVARHPALRPLAAAAGFLRNRATPGDLGLELTTLATALLAGLAVFAGYAHRLQERGLPPGDRAAADLAGDLRAGGALHVAKVLTALGSFPVAAVVIGTAAFFLLRRNRRLEAIVLAAGLVLTTILVNAAKLAEHRPRPAHPLTFAPGFSYPSGHSADAVAWVAVAVALGRALPTWSRRAAVLAAAVLIAVVVGATRVYLRVHYLSDVLGGLGLGAAVYAACGLVALVVFHLRNNSALR